MDKVAIVVPCYNEEKRIASVIDGAKRYSSFIIVVNDGSTDNTRVVAKEHGAVVIDQSHIGAGAATTKGIQYALDNHVEVIVTIDGDGQHDPKEISKLLLGIECGYDVVFGVRNINRHNMPFLRWLGNRIFWGMSNIGESNKISDTECGFRAFRTDVFNKFKIESPRFGFCDEIIFKVRKYHLSYTTYPIKTMYGEEIHKYSFVPAMKRGLEIPYAIIKWRLKTW